MHRPLGKRSLKLRHTERQHGRTCGAIDEASISSKAIDKHVIVNSRDKNAIIARFRDKMKFFIFMTNVMICHLLRYVIICHDIPMDNSQTVLSVFQYS